MDSYTITITPNDDSGNSTTLTVDTATGQARITSVHMNAPAGLTGAQLPSVDVGLLLQAVTGPATTPAAITATPTPVAEPAAHPTPAPADAEEPSITAATVTPEPATGDTTPHTPAVTPAKRASRRPAAWARTAVEGKASSRGARGDRNPPAGKTAAPRKAAGKRATAAAAASAAESAERVYRKMPDDFPAVYRQAGTTAAIADHYGVPRYTAQGWVGRHKKQEAAGKN
jgi:hypothetical protein